ncbi:Cysteine desulfurase SufE subunit [gamma proteobacterium HdN1]|nr:Cysteine desulfurase SufE subunit [gamma proteobacterium HdN1]
MGNPFGSEITSDILLDDIGFLDDWETRYRYIIDLGKRLPEMSESLKIPETLLGGCQSQVWIVPHFENATRTLTFEVDSDAFIVKGLLAMVMAAYNQKTPEQILQFDIEHYFAETGLLRHLSPTRGNGLKSMVKRIQGVAKENS